MFLDGKSHAHVCVLECVYILYSSHLIRSFSSAVLLKTLIIQYGRSLLKSHARKQQKVCCVSGRKLNKSPDTRYLRLCGNHYQK